VEEDEDDASWSEEFGSCADWANGKWGLPAMWGLQARSRDGGALTTCPALSGRPGSSFSVDETGGGGGGAKFFSNLGRDLGFPAQGPRVQHLVDR